jgi:SOS response regulatory protein OraA/RecX
MADTQDIQESIYSQVCEYVARLLICEEKDREEVIRLVETKGFDTKTAQQLVDNFICQMNDSSEFDTGEAYEYAEKLLYNQENKLRVVNKLVKKGLTEETAQNIVAEILNNISEQEKREELERAKEQSALEMYAIKQQAADMIDDGKNKEEIIQYLVEQGIDSENAASMTNRIETQVIREQKESKGGATTTIILGLVIGGIGVALTVADTGRIFYGAIIVGIIMFLRGLSKL